MAWPMNGKWLTMPRAGQLKEETLLINQVLTAGG